MRIPLLAAIMLFVFSFIIDFYISLDLKSAGKKKLRKGYNVSALLCWIFLVVIMCMPKRAEDSNLLPVMWMLYTYLTIYAAKFFYVVCSLIGRLIGVFHKGKKRGYVCNWIGVCLGIVAFSVMWLGVGVTRKHIVVNRVDISSPSIPQPFNGYTIAQISDVHVGTWGNDTTFVSHLVDSVNALHPDLIVFTGDIVNRETKEIEPFLPVLSRLKAKDGVLSILGNHDYGDYMDWKHPGDRDANNRLLAKYQKGIGWCLMNNERRFIVKDNDSIMVLGVENWGDPPFPTYGDLEKALSSSQDSVYHQNDRYYKILLSHNPEHWNQYVSKKTNIALTLSGHTHAMQMMLDLGGWKWSPAKYRYEQWGGLYDRLNENGQPTQLYVNIGAGEVGMPARLLGAYPEITLFTLHHTSNRE
ncbi:MAG: metallophosphoesterase [Bacteroides sp.]|nr:metallophosphoesterase [Bacteroides sp.]